MAAYFFGITDKGKRREKNEDTFIVQEIPGTSCLLACVIDGVGGYTGGEVAAGIARAVILERLQHLNGDIAGTLQLAVVAANEKIQEQRRADKGYANMACVLTCVIADVKNNKLWYAHVGDTRLYLLRDKSLVKISSDHSAVGFLEESGRLSEMDAMRHPRRNEIDRALGFEAAIAEAGEYIESGKSPFLPGDIILLCSDGLSDMISSAGISSILSNDRSMAEKARQLVNAANAAGGNDNITAVLVENKKQPKKQQPVVKTPLKKNGAAGGYLPAAKPADPQPGRVVKIRSKRNAIIGLSVLSLLLLIAVTVLLIKQRADLDNRTAVLLAPLPKQKDVNLAGLMNAMHDSAKLHTLPAGTAFSMAEPVVINKDSFSLRGNGAHISSDLNYTGPAFIIDPAAKQIVLDSVLFENFDVALLIKKSNIVFRNVRFINCRVPVQYAAAFADTTISGRFKDSIFLTSQSLKKR